MRIAVALALGLGAVSCGPAGGSIAVPASASGTHFLSVSVTGTGRVMSIPPGIDCPGTCSAAFGQGSAVTLAASPLADSMFLEWGGDCMGAMGCFVDIDSEHQVVANFQTMEMPMMLRQ